MSVKKIDLPYPVFFDDDGTALKTGKIYIGEVNKDPETYPISVYFDTALSVAASQPIRTINGYISNAGSPANIYVGSEYSITVTDKNDNLVYTVLNSGTDSNLSTFDGITAESTGTTVKTITLADNGGAIIEVYGAGLKGSTIAANRVKFHVWRLTGTMFIERIESEEYRGGGDFDIYFDLVQSGNDGIIKAYTVSGTWAVSGEIKTLSSGAITFS